MYIKYKFIEHERTEDAPFVGALISAIGCSFGCERCFNQHLLSAPVLSDTAENIIREVKSNPLNQGIILAGLEWSEQPKELVVLVQEAYKNGLEVMLYSGCETKEEFYERIGGEDKLPPCYIKVGRYDESMRISGFEMYGVRLASANQMVYKKRGI